MSLQIPNSRKTLEPRVRGLRLSEILNPRCLSNGDTLSLSFSDLSEIDKIPGCYLKITKLNFSHNLLTNLNGLFQFKHLTHFNVTHNRISSLSELIKIPNKENVVVLCLEGNPCARHPDLINLALIVLPRLVEVDGFKISDHTRQDIRDGVILSKKVIDHLCANDLVIQELDRDVKRYKLEMELLQVCKAKANRDTGPFWEDINARHMRNLKKMVELPRMPNFAHHSRIRPYMILDYIDIASRFFKGSHKVEESEYKRMYKWMFCEILLQLHNWGMHGLQLFLQENTTGSDLSEHFEEELEYFRSLAIGHTDIKAFSDIFPDFSEEAAKRNKILETQRKATDWELFPIFSCNSDYLKALLNVLQSQTLQIEELHREKEELLNFDSSCLGIQSRFDVENDEESELHTEFSQELRNSSRTTIRRVISPNNLPLSPEGKKQNKTAHFKLLVAEEEDEDKLESLSEFEKADQKKAEIEEALRNEYEEKYRIALEREKENIEVEKSKIIVERNKIEEKLKAMEDNGKLEREKISFELSAIAEKRREIENIEKERIELEKMQTQKKADILKQKHHRILTNGWSHLERAYYSYLGENFSYLKAFSQQCCSNNYLIAESFHSKYLLKGPFTALRCNYIIYKTKKIRADNFFDSRILIENFLRWKKHLAQVKSEKALKLEEKKRKLAEKAMIKREFEKMLKRLTSNEKNIKRLWKILKKKNNSSKKECACGGFKCEACVKEKTKFIKHELHYLQGKIAESKLKQSNKCNHYK